MTCQQRSLFCMRYYWINKQKAERKCNLPKNRHILQERCVVIRYNWANGSVISKASADHIPLSALIILRENAFTMPCFIVLLKWRAGVRKQTSL